VPLRLKKRAAMENGWVEERFVAQFEAGRLSVRLERPEAVVLSELLSAYNLRPTRAEPLYELARYYRSKNGHAMATLFAKSGVRTPLPNDRLFIVTSVYTWRLLDELSVAAYAVGDYATSQRACKALLEQIERGLEVPEAEAERIRNNANMANERIGPK